jgi:hypothetical protein
LSKKNYIDKPPYPKWVRESVEIIKREQAYKEEVLQGSRKRIRESEEKREKIGDGMLSAKDNLIAKNQEIDRIKHSNQEVEKFGKLAPRSSEKVEVEKPIAS